MKIYSSRVSNLSSSRASSFSRRSGFVGRHNASGIHFKGQILTLQIMCLAIVGVGALLLFPNIVEFSTTSAQAQEGTSQVKVYNNFQQLNYQQQNKNGAYITEAAPAAATTPSDANSKQYSVVTGDTVGSVVAKLKVDQTAFLKVNNIILQTPLKAGDTLLIP